VTPAAILRYAVIAADGRLRKWQLACIENLEQSGEARLRHFMTMTPAREMDQTLAGGDSFAAFCRRIDLPSQALIGASDPERFLPDVVRVLGSGAVTGTAQALQALDLDFVLLFGPKALAAQLENVARYGVWYFVHSDIARFTSPSPCFWEIYRNHNVTGASLLKYVDARCAGIVLKAGYFATITDSFRKNVESAYASLPLWPLQVCRELRSGVAGYFSAAPVPDAPVQLPAPNAFQILAFRMLQARNAIANFAQVRLFLVDWNIGRLGQPVSAFIACDERAEVSDLPPYVRGVFVADPYAFSAQDRTYVFCEQFRYKTGRGSVAVGEFSTGGGLRVKPAIEEPFHLSYPQVFEHRGVIYCMPESAEARRVSLYEAADFPHVWRRAHVLLEGFAAVDSTLLWLDDTWWLFCTNADEGFKGHNSHLHIWYASDLFGAWTPHPRNPVKIDVRCSRPAGQFIRHAGALYRPAQDCSRTYGGSIAINRVDKLSRTEFQETLVGTILPPAGKYGKGLHTISAADGFYLVDVKRYVFEPRAILAVLKTAVKSTALGLGVSEKRIQSLKKPLKM
jgi:hypothetical protein